MKIMQFTNTAITPIIARQTAELIADVWRPPLTGEELTQQILTARNHLGFTLTVGYADENLEKIVACAGGVMRLIRFLTAPQAEPPQKILALFGISVAAGFRRQHYGHAVVECLFQRVDAGEFPLALWQTATPEFYQKFGAIIVRNRFINSLNKDTPETNPFHLPVIMAYPAAAWNDQRAVVDLLGDGF